MGNKSTDPLEMPHDDETELTIIKACMLEGFEDQKAEIVTKVKPQDFYRAANREYFQSVLNLDSEGRFPTAKRIYADIKNRNKQKVATLAGISKIYDAELISVDIKNNISDLKDLADRRDLIEVANAVIKKSGNGSHYTAANVIEYISQETEKIKNDTVEFESFYDCIDMCRGEHLLEMEFPELQWIIKDILTAGVTILAGKPKAGKSVLALNICAATATGGMCLDREVEQGRVLYLHLEDNRRRIQTRLKAMIPIDDYTGKRPSGLSNHLELAVTWPRMGEGGLRALNSYCAEIKPRLVVIDTFKAFQSEAATLKLTKQQYDVDYDEFIKLRPIAEKHNTSILVVAHARKAHSDDPVDIISGTLGKAGAVDNCIVMTERKGNRVKIYTVGRDVYNESYTLKYTKSTWTWSLLGKSYHIDLIESQQKVLSYLIQESSKKEPATLAEICANTGTKRSNLQNRILPKLIENGYVEKLKKGCYYAV